MQQPNYHGILVDFSFEDTIYPEKFKLFAKRKSDDWTLYGIIVEDSKIDAVIKDIQNNMKSKEPYYQHFYNDEQMIVVFKDRIFTVTPQISTWKEIIEYGKTLNIPQDQLTFWPNRFQDEIHYFKYEDFIIL
jgi:hypothetical protein